MKLNISSPQKGTNISIETNFNTERVLYGKSLGNVIEGFLINPDYAGWKMQLVGGSDKQGFPMDPKLSTEKRQRLLRKEGDIGYKPKRNGERKRKSVRYAVVNEDISVLCLKITNDTFTDKEKRKITVEPKHIDGLTNVVVDKTHLPKRFSKLKAMLGLKVVDVSPKEVRNFVFNAIPPAEDGKKRKQPKIRMTRIQKKNYMKRIQRRKTMNRLRKNKSEREVEEFMKKYSNWLKTK